MSEIRLPVFKSVTICDDAVADPASGKMHVIGICEGFRPTDPDPPFRLRRLCVLVQLSDWQGPLELRVQVVSAKTLQQTFVPQLLRVVIPSPILVVRAPFRFRDCSFRETGEYLVELYCNGVFVEDRRFVVLEPV